MSGRAAAAALLLCACPRATPALTVVKETLAEFEATDGDD